MRHLRQIGSQCNATVGKLRPSLRNRLIETKHGDNIGEGFSPGFDAAAFDDREVALNRHVFARQSRRRHQVEAAQNVGFALHDAMGSLMQRDGIESDRNVLRGNGAENLNNCSTVG